MKASIQKLQKFFRLESERGYDNRAVVGGLERMLGPWEADARNDQLPEELIKAVVTRLRDYAQLSPNSRAEALEGLWKRIHREAGEDASPLPLPPAVNEVLSTESKPPRPTRKVSSRRSATSEKSDASTPPSQPPPRQVPRAPITDGKSAALNAPVTVLQGVGPRHGQTLERLGLKTLADMMYFVPRRYDDYSQLKPINRLEFGEEVTVIGTLQNVSSRSIRGGAVQITEAIVSDGSGALRLTWFNQPWIGKRIRSGNQVVLAGKTEQYLGRLVINNPELELLEQEHLHTHRIVPVYSLTANITQRWLRRSMYQVVSYWAPRVQDMLLESILSAAEVISLSEALQQIHFPDSWEKLARARQRLAFDEIFLLQMGVLRQKRSWQERAARVFAIEEEMLSPILERLPFNLTGAQQSSLQDIRQDLASGKPMNRLLQGDVGSGKTIVAALGAAIIANSGAQSAFMAPTGILAEQHYRNLSRLFCTEQDTDEGFWLRPEQVRLLVGSTPEAERREILAALECGDIKILIGTHALLEEPVVFKDLEYVVVDEQHRFGVEQRAVLRAKGSSPHLLVMTATPIPRSLALTVYGDLDLSVMDEMPVGRQIVETQIFFPRERERSYELVRSRLGEGQQAFIIYPLVEESDGNETKAAVNEFERLSKEIFPEYKLGLLHGRMRPDEKDAVMADFRDNQVQILVSTSVVEVGVDVPNATAMIIEGANRFGLSQLHQFRGRVGRGEIKSFCILIPDSPDDASNQRLTAMVETNNGFFLAERDLEQRGPGSFLGTRQSGYHSDLNMASLTDVHLIIKARDQAQNLFQQDPELTAPEHQLLSEAMERFWGSGRGDIS
jgi:ATP-dependent DNA helicase RecG